MLSELEFESWSKKMNLLNIAKVVINRIRTSPPSRNVGGGKYNVWGKYPSVKMGMTIQFESHKVELPAIYHMEHDENVLEYYDQPFPIKLTYASKNNKNIGVLSTPDFFLIRKDGAMWEEWKTEVELIKLSEKSPNRYFKDEYGVWRCPPGEVYAQQYGLKYVVRSDSEINWVLLRNLMFLEDYFLDKNYQVSDASRKEILEIVEKDQGITISDIFEVIKVASIDDVYQLIAIEEIYIDIFSFLIADRKTAKVFSDREWGKAYTTMSLCNTDSTLKSSLINLDIGKKFFWNEIEWTLLYISDNSYSLLSMEHNVIDIPKETFHIYLNSGKIWTNCDATSDNMISEINSILMSASKKDLETATYHYDSIKPYLLGEKTENPTVSARTLRSWLKKYRESEKVYNNGFIGLIPKTKNRGNYERKLPSETIQLMNKYIGDEYGIYKQKTRFVVYGQFVNECEKEGILEPTYKTFCQEIKRYRKEVLARQREGDRAAYKYESFYWELSMTTPRHGDRPFEICHIDHTELDIELISSETGKNLGRPWLTLLQDAYDRKILSFYLTFDPPSYRSNMVVLRACVRRFNRLPQTVIVDGGKEFSSVYFESLLAMYQVSKKTRPAAKARFGSVIERLFGTSNKQFIHNLRGNTQITKNVRQVTKSVNPKNLSVWTLRDLNDALGQWCYVEYDNREHSTLGISPNEAFERENKMVGERRTRFISYDENFIMMTLPSPKSERVKVQPSIGVRINYIDYWSDEMKEPRIEKQKVFVKYDPFDIGIAYAFINKQWVCCHSQYYTIFKGKTEKELSLIIEEIRKGNRNASRKTNINAKTLANFITNAEATEVILLQRIKDRENLALPTIDSNYRPKNIELHEDEIDTSTTSIEGEDISQELYLYGVD